MASDGLCPDRSRPASLLAGANIIIAAVAAIVAAGSYTTLAGLLITRFSIEFGWTATAISIGVAINMLLYGLFAPFALLMMRRFGIQQISIAALILLLVGSAVCLIPNIMLFNLAWGILIGVGTGSLTTAYGAFLARQYFPTQIGFVTGIMTAASVVGQFALLPLWAEAMTHFGWRAPIFGAGLLTLLAVILNIRFMPAKTARQSSDGAERLIDGLERLIQVFLAALTNKIFWTLVLLFIICGATTNGIMWSHFTPAANDCGISITSASSALLLVGIFNVAGTITAGWLADRASVRAILSIVFAGRALTLLWLPSIFASVSEPQLYLFGAIFGLLDVATVPPVIVICGRVYGDRGPEIFGWINAFHQLGAGGMAFIGAMIRASSGSYDLLWLLSGLIALLAAALVFSDRYDREKRIA
jgi:predicted MFS family arabinose efflux permease